MLDLVAQEPFEFGQFGVAVGVDRRHLGEQAGHGVPVVLEFLPPPHPVDVSEEDLDAAADGVLELRVVQVDLLQVGETVNGRSFGPGRLVGVDAGDRALHGGQDLAERLAQGVDRGLQAL